LLVFSAGERQAMPGQSGAMARQSNALACLSYLKERAGLKHGFGSGNKKSPAISDGGLEATVI